MKYLSLLLLGLVALAGTVKGGVISNNVNVEVPEVPDLGTAIKLYYNAVKRIMPCGFAPYNIPVLSPFYVKHIPINLDLGVFKITGQVDNLFVKGLDNYEILFIEYNDTTKRLSYDMIMYDIQVLAEYKIDHSVNISGHAFNWSSNGVFNNKFEDYRVVANLKIAPKPNATIGVEVSDVQGHVYMSDIQISNWNNVWDVAVNKFFNRFLGDYLLTLLQQKQDTIATLYNEYAIPLINRSLENTNMEMLVDFFLEQIMAFDQADCNSN